MMKNFLIVIFILAISISLVAQQSECCKDGKKCEKCDKSKEMAACMEMAQKYGTPGPEHKLMDGCIGSWKAMMKMYGMDGNILCTSEATAERKWIMGGRFVQEDYKDGNGFEGTSLMGYDRMKKQYVVIWFDNMGTGFFMSEGNYDKEGKVLTMMSAEYTCPMAGKRVKNKSVSREINNNEELFEMYTVDCESGKEFKNMEIVYTRK